MAGVEPRGSGGWHSRLRRFGRDVEGLAAVEAALLAPVALGLLGLVVFGGEGLSIQRKVTLVSRTVADLVGQAPVSTTGCGTGTATLKQSDIDYYLSLSTLILYPYAASGLQAELSEVQVASGGGATATVIWSEGYNGGVARPVGQVISIDPSIVSAGAGYLLLGEVQYAYQPLNIWQRVGAFAISDSIFMAPRSASQVSISWRY
jgi:Flp pilus assembly pilin Flp